VDFRRGAASIPIVSHGKAGRYWIKLQMTQDIIRTVGVKVKMHVSDDMGVGRHRYLRRVTLDSLLEHGDKLYGDSEEEKELFDECVDMTIVSRICQLST
jgi:hypothetical protein